MKKPIVGKNDLLSCNPELAKEYDKEKNIEPIEYIFIQSNKKYWWKCSKCGHSWEQRVADRNYLKSDGTYRYSHHQKKSRCPKCSKINKTSFQEQAILFYIKKYFSDVVNSYKNKELLGRKELDIYIPSLNTAIEYDGAAWHKDVNKDLNKSILCKENNIKLIRVREKMCPKIKDDSIKIVINKNTISNLEDAIKKILLILNINNAIVNIDKDTQSIQKQYKKQKIKRSIASNKKLLKEFSPNNLISPENISLFSNDKWLWICPEGHEYSTSANTRMTGSGCPYCSNQKVLKGFNDLKTRYPEIAQEWDYEKNYPLTPIEILPGTEKKFWWICPKGHSYQAYTSNRCGGHSRCPYCSNKKVLRGYNDLATAYPEIAKEWNYKKNYPLKPNNIVYGSNKKCWFKCSKCSYEWKTQIRKRTVGKTGCPRCKNIIPKKINQYDLNDNLIKTFNSITEACNSLNKSTNCHIIACCKGKLKTSYGYIWKYADEITNNNK